MARGFDTEWREGTTTHKVVFVATAIVIGGMPVIVWLIEFLARSFVR